tara:strand:+ start:31 stop:369 length:339 start_codon:yes stop_codon:yes gene_type:complete
MEIQLSNQYSNHLNKLKVAQNNFDCKPSKKTATILSNLKNKKFNYSEKYTSEYNQWREADRKKAQKNWMIEITETFNMCNIENDFKKGVINNDIRIILHDQNEQKANQLRTK